MKCVSHILPALFLISLAHVAVWAEAPPRVDEAGALREENRHLKAENEKLREEIAALREKLSQLEGTSSSRGVIHGSGEGSPVIVVKRGQDGGNHFSPQVTVTRPVPLERRYDAKLGGTVVQTRFLPFRARGALRDRVWLRLKAADQGPGSGEAGRSMLMLIETRETRGLFKDLSAVELELDGERYGCAIEGYEVQRQLVRRGRKRIHIDQERLKIRLPGDLVSRVLRSESATVLAGKTRLGLSMEQVMQMAAVWSVGGESFRGGDGG